MLNAEILFAITCFLLIVEVFSGMTVYLLYLAMGFALATISTFLMGDNINYLLQAIFVVLGVGLGVASRCIYKKFAKPKHTTEYEDSYLVTNNEVVIVHNGQVEYKSSYWQLTQEQLDEFKEGQHLIVKEIRKDGSLLLEPVRVK